MQSAERDQLFLNIAALMAKHSTCLRGHTGAVIALHDRIISTGYNGAPPGLPHCTEVGCGGGVPVEGTVPSREGYQPMNFPHGCTRATHAEANAVALCARWGLPTDSATMYCTHSPCVACAHVMAAAGIRRVVFADYYRVREPLQMLRDLGMEVNYLG
jgi:dCMP deaminase